MNKMSKQLLAAMTALSLVTIPTVTEAAPAIQINIDGVKQTYDVQPYIKNSRTLVPLRGIFEKLGATLYWDGSTQTIFAVKGDTVINLQIGANKAIVNGKEIALDQVAEISNSRTMVPLRFVSEALGADVKWNGAINGIDIKSGVYPVLGLSKQGSDVLNLPLRYEIDTLDTSAAADNVTHTVLNQVNEGLLRLDEKGQVIPGVAKAWEVSLDGLTYTFTLRDDAKWSDGSQVTAHDFVYAWKRTLNPQTDAPYSFLLSWIKGGQSYTNGQGSADQVMIKAKNNTTLEVTLETPMPAFLYQTAFPVFFPQKIAVSSAPGYGTEANKSLYNGPFKVTTWAHNQFIGLTKNEHYWDRNNVKLNKVNYLIPLADTDLSKLYEAKAIDRMQLTSSNAAQYRNSAELIHQNTLITQFLKFNQAVGVLKNTKVRKALAYGIDTDHFAESIYSVNAKSATGLVPPGIVDGQGGDFRTVNGDLIKRSENLATAKSLLQEGLKEQGLSQFPKLTLLVDSGSFGDKIGNIIQEQWYHNLGITIQIESVPFKTRLQRENEGKFDFLVSAWGADYNDPINFLDMWVKNSDFNSTGYSNSNYDELIAKAQSEPDTATRMQLLLDAEKILIDEMPVAPLTFRQSTYVMKPYVRGLVPANNLGPEYDLKNVYIQGRQ